MNIVIDRVRFPWLAFAGLLMLLLAACGGADVPSLESARPQISEAQWQRLASRRIYFGHQSVGGELMKGVEQWSSRPGGATLRVVDTGGKAAPSGPLLAHALNGENEKPQTKIDGFAATLAKGEVFDLAFFKFCYADIEADTDVDRLFASYKQSMTRLKQQHPKTVFLHSTAPVTVVQSGPKAWFKRLLGRSDQWAEANTRRERFNQLLRAEYRNEPLFDLAAVESTWEDGRRRTFEANGNTYPALIDAYSYDGRHLNERGRAWAAGRLLEFLAKVDTPAAAQP